MSYTRKELVNKAWNRVANCVITVLTGERGVLLVALCATLVWLKD